MMVKVTAVTPLGLAVPLATDTPDRKMLQPPSTLSWKLYGVVSGWGLAKTTKLATVGELPVIWAICSVIWHEAGNTVRAEAVHETPLACAKQPCGHESS